MPLPEEARRALAQWFRRAGRDLPWRRTKDPYSVWVSEVMLQQTQVATALPYYEAWMRRFPGVEALAQASEEEVLAAWQGLGYYRRCRLLLEGARRVVAEGWPATAKGWRAIPGVGRYTAGAIASICYGEAAPVVDGNVERVYARVVDDLATDGDLHRRAWDWAERSLDRANPGDWNQALMELGALVCRRDAPDCSGCPLRAWCLAAINGTVAARPAVARRTATVHESRTIELLWMGDRFAVRRIPPGGWWEGLWEFPEASSAGPWSEELGTFRHSVTHHRIRYRVRLRRVVEGEEGFSWRTVAELAETPMPAPQRKALGLALRYLGLAEGGPVAAR
ncbi:MAG: A/G-specific adenine glycosylase [Fimbriimonadaceae bacterium]|nr:A/G-specific adenine glycosylase [Fimbriimonadaceae bacterium]